MYLGERKSPRTNAWIPGYNNQRIGKKYGFDGLDEFGLGPLVIPAISAVGSIAAPLMSLISGKKHPSPWGFLVDDYPDNIVANETKINSLQSQLARLLGQQPPPPYAPASGFSGKKGSDAWQATMMPLIAKYAPGYTQYVPHYERALGDGYQQAYASQLDIINRLSQQVAQVSQQRGIIDSSTIPGSATAPPPLSSMYPGLMTPPGMIQPGFLTAPPGAPGTYYQSPISPIPGLTTPSYLPNISSPIPSNITISNPGAGSSSGQPNFMASMGSWPILLVGGIGVLMVLMAPGAPAKTAVRTPKKARKR